GVYSCDSVQIQIDGAAVDITSALAAIASGIRLMPQELSVHPDLSVAENIALGSMPQRKISGIGRTGDVFKDLHAGEGLGDVGDLEPRHAALR
ncbi:sugar ABC transporter ATP-binding protein, partial [Rhizobium leguminosarum]